METAKLLLCIVSATSVPTLLLGQAPGRAALPSAINGTYVGLEKMESLSPEDPFTDWYHESTLFIRNNEVVIDKQPVTFRKGKKTYSASDGGFLTFRGRIFFREHRRYVALRLVDSDYVMFRIGPGECEPYSKIDVFPMRISGKEIEVHGVRYKPKPISAQMIQVWTKTLVEQPVHYDGKRHYRDPKARACSVPPDFEDR